MRTIGILSAILTVVTSYTAFAGGGGGGGVLASTGQNIVFKTGESEEFVEFQLGKANGGTWVVDTHKVHKLDISKYPPLVDALNESEKLNRWTAITKK